VTDCGVAVQCRVVTLLSQMWPVPPRRVSYGFWKRTRHDETGMTGQGALGASGWPVAPIWGQVRGETGRGRKIRMRDRTGRNMAGGLVRSMVEMEQRREGVRKRYELEVLVGY
jgi:hypothetical protein